MGRYQARLEQKGHLLGRIVDIGAELYAIACACVYADTIGREHPDRRQEAFELADLFCSQARRRADRLFAQLWANDDARQYEVAQQVLSGRYEWFEQDVLDPGGDGPMMPRHARSEEHTSELQSRHYLVCRLLLEKKKIILYHLDIISTTLTLSHYTLSIFLFHTILTII